MMLWRDRNPSMVLARTTTDPMEPVEVADMVTANRAGLAVLAGAALLIFTTLPSDAATTNVSLQNIAYVPQATTIAAGDTVTWTNNDFTGHSVTADDGSFDSSPSCPPTCLSNGDTFTHTFATAGSFPYHCRIHGAAGGVGMSGTIIVQAAVTSTTPTSSTTTTHPPSTTPTTASTTSTTTRATGAVASNPRFTG